MLEFLKKLFGGGNAANSEKAEVAPGVRKTLAELVVVQVCSEDVEEVRRILAEVTDLADENGAEVKMVQSDIAIAVFESGSGKGLVGAGSLKFKSGLFDRFSEKVRGLYGVTETVMGNLGGEKRMTYGYVYPGLTEAIERLEGMKVGDFQSHEYPDWFGEDPA